MSIYWGHRTTWPRNSAGGIMPGPAITKNRHNGVRCYGLHRNGQCFPYQPEPLKNPVKQAVPTTGTRRW